MTTVSIKREMVHGFWNIPQSRATQREWGALPALRPKGGKRVWAEARCPSLPGVPTRGENGLFVTLLSTPSGDMDGLGTR